MTTVADKTLAQAFVAMQADLPKVEADSTNPHFRSKFVSLGHLLAKVRPILNKHGFSVIQLPSRTEDGRPSLTTTLLHESGESIERETPLLLVKNDPQALGSAMTYTRRYALSAALGISDQEDDDGNAGSEKPTPRGPRSVQLGNNDVPRDLIAKQRVEKITQGFKDKGLTLRDIDGLLASVGLDALRARSRQAVLERISGLTADEADRLEKALAIVAGNEPDGPVPWEDEAA